MTTLGASALLVKPASDSATAAQVQTSSGTVLLNADTATKRLYTLQGTTASIAAGATGNLTDVSGYGSGGWLFWVHQSNGGTTVAGAAIVLASGTALIISSLNATNITWGSSGTTVQVTNNTGSSQTMDWTAAKLL